MFVSGVGVCAFQIKASKRKMQLSAHCLWAQVIMQAAVVERTVNLSESKHDAIVTLPVALRNAI